MTNLKRNKAGRALLSSKCLFLLLCVLCSPNPSPAANRFWNGGGANNNWTNAANWGGTAPVAGDDLIFQANALIDATSLNNTNNFPTNTVFRSITIQAGSTNYLLNGSPIVFTNTGVVALSGQSGGSNTVNLNIELNVNQTFEQTVPGGPLTISGAVNLNGNALSNNVATSSRSEIRGVISGSGELIKNGVGTLQLAGGSGNIYSGTTTVNSGTLELNKSVGDAIPGPLVIGDGSGGPDGDIVRSLTSTVIGAVPIRINSSGLLDLDGFSDTIGSLTLNGGDVTTGAGLLSLSGNLTNLASGASISGNLALIGITHIFNISASLTISAAISGSGSAGITQIGSGQWTLSGANTFPGQTIVSGFLIAANDAALGANSSTTNGTILNENATLLVQGVNVGDEFLTLTNLDDFRSSGTASWSGPITLNDDVDLNVFGGSFTLSGAITGLGGVTKGQTGTLIYSGSGVNTYSGGTTVDTGVLQLSKSTPTAGIVNGTLTIGDDLGGTDADVVRETIANQINSSVPITINSSGLLDLNNVNDALGPITFNGGHLTTGTGTATLVGNVTANASTNNLALIEGNVSMSSTRTFNVANGGFSPDLEVSAAVSGAGGISKIGFGEMSLTASNNYSGLTTVSNGLLRLENSFALGSTNTGTVVNSGAILTLLFGIHVGLEPLTLSGPGNSASFGALDSQFGSNSWAGAISLATNSTIGVFTNDFLNLSGPISGTDGITKIGPGTLMFSGSTANSYSGSTFVNEGTLLLNKSVPNGSLHGPLIVGDNLGGGLADVVRSQAPDQIFLGVDVTVNGSGLLDLNGFSDGVENITIIGGNIETGSGILTMKNNMTASSDSVGGTALVNGNLALATTRTITVTNGPSAADLTLQAAVSGTGGIVKSGSGFMILSHSNSFSGPVTVNDGTLELLDDFAAGTTAGGVTVNSNALLRLISSIHIGAEALTLNSTNITSALESISGSNSWAGNVTLDTNTIINVDVGDTLNLLGAISGPGTLTKIDTGTLIYSGGGTNTYTNTTFVNAGTLELSKTNTDAAIRGNLVIGDGSGGALSDVVRLNGNAQIATASEIIIASSGLLDLNEVGEGIGALSGSGQVDTGASGTGALLINGNTNTTYSGTIIGAGSLTKQIGTGTFTLTGTNTYAGPTTVTAGTLSVNGFQPQSAVTVGASGTLGGLGTVGNMLVSGNLQPGFTSDIVSSVLTSSNLAFSASGDYFVDLTGPTAGVDYDQMNIRGTNTLANATLHVNPAFIKPVGVGQQFTIINNDGAESVTGTFNGLPNGSAINVSGHSFVINYGNDVVLTLTNIPASIAASLLASGNGNHAVDPNDCNNLYLAISNSAPSPMIAVSATLSTTNDSVLVTQPFSKYSDIPVNGRGTNTAPFQISTLPSFPCGSNIFLTLTLYAPTVGYWNLPVVLTSGEQGNTPSRYDNSITTNIPDTGTIESTNVVAGFAGPITKVAASLYLTHTFDNDLSISLISPDGVSIDLSSNNGGSGDDYGTNCAPDTARTTFDDSAATAITAGASPFVGTFRPEVTLSNFIGGSANGNWRLHINDANGGSLGALRCWSLFLYPATCASGSGYCLTCPGVFSNSITAADPAFTNRLFTSSVASSCATPKSCPGINSAIGPFHFDTYTFTNTGPGTCVSVGLDTACSSMFAMAYLNAFDTNNLCLNYLADIGANPPGKNSFSFTVPFNTKFVVVVHAGGGATCPDYKLIVSGLPCPQPTLDIQPATTPQNVRLDWSTAAGGFNLEATPSLAPTNWSSITNEPLVSAGRYNVTNPTTPTNAFYRLRKP
jgi:autotransporter-associated beta strand protein